MSASERGVVAGALVESVRSARAQPVSTLLIAAAVLLSVAAGVVTAGRSLQTERDALGAVDAITTRTVRVTVGRGPAVGADELAMLAGISRVEWVVGLGAVDDVFNAATGGGDPVPSRTVYSSLPAALVTFHGRPPAPGEALVGVRAQERLGLPAGVGGVVTNAGRDIPVVGTLDSVAPLDELADIVSLWADDSTDAGSRRILVQAATTDDVADIGAIVSRQLTADGERQIEVATDEGLATLRRALAGELARGSREQLAASTAAGALIVAMVVLGSVQSRRRDLGRRRALGASRALVTGLLVGQTGAAALLGAGFSAIFGVLAATQLGVDLAVTLSVTALAVLAAVAATVPPALLAAFRDPVRVLRTP